MLLQSPAGIDDVYNYYVSRMRVSTTTVRAGGGTPVTGGGNEVLPSANIYVTPGFESRSLFSPRARDGNRRYLLARLGRRTRLARNFHLV